MGAGNGVGAVFIPEWSFLSRSCLTVLSSPATIHVGTNLLICIVFIGSRVGQSVQRRATGGVAGVLFPA
jgi:hypothetical protein